ncbi:MAG TPA: MBL fold metallo-hydrolase [Bryobacteraceae bacterium]
MGFSPREALASLTASGAEAPRGLKPTLHPLVAACVFLALSSCSSRSGVKTYLLEAQKSLGNVKSIRYSGSGRNGFFGQALSAAKDWPLREVTSYTRTVDYDRKSSREEIVFAQPVFGGQRQNAESSGDKAWNVGPTGPVPQPATADERQLQIWMTPQGFVKAALDSGNAIYDSARNAVSFTALGKYRISGWFSDAHTLVRSEARIDNPVLGDMPVTAVYSGYRDFNGVQFPTKIRENQGGSPVWDLTISDVQPNAPADLPIPDAVKNAPAPREIVQTTKLDNGVWLLTGGTHHSVLVEFKDYAAVVEAPLNEERSAAVLAEAKKLLPDKPVKYVVVTHHHFDHIGGLRSYVAQGAAVITHESNKEYFENILQRPATLTPDLLAKTPKPPMVQPVADKYVLTDGAQTIEVYATQGDTHSDELLVAYLPQSKILVEADSYSPPALKAPPPSPPPPNAVVLYDNIQRLGLNVSTIAPIHGRGAVSFAEFRRFIGK